MSPSEQSEASATGRKLSCASYFNALWSCYSPVQQMQHYYRVGVLVDCSGKLKDLFDCLNSTTKRQSQSEEILKTREQSKPHIWSFRSPEEASSHWKKLFGKKDGTKSSTRPQQDVGVVEFKRKKKDKK